MIVPTGWLVSDSSFGAVPDPTAIVSVFDTLGTKNSSSCPAPFGTSRPGAESPPESSGPQTFFVARASLNRITLEALRG